MFVMVVPEMISQCPPTQFILYGEYEDSIVEG